MLVRAVRSKPRQRTVYGWACVTIIVEFCTFLSLVHVTLWASWYYILTLVPVEPNRISDTGPTRLHVRNLV